MPKMNCGFLLFPGMTQLDLTGPYEVFPRAPDVEAILVAKTTDPVTAQWGMQITPDVDFDACPPLDLLLVPGGFGVEAAMGDTATLSFVSERALSAKYLVSVCTGALLLGAAGLLRDRKVTTHWAYRELLKSFGAAPTEGRVIRDQTLFTGGGVTAGIDVALTVVAEVFGAEVAQEIQLSMEYTPAPPFNAGTPETAPIAVHAAVAARYAPIVADMRARLVSVAEAGKTR